MPGGFPPGFGVWGAPHFNNFEKHKLENTSGETVPLKLQLGCSRSAAMRGMPRTKLPQIKPQFRA